MNNKKSMKALMLSIVLAAVLLPTTGNAQAYSDETAESYNSGAFYELIAYDTYLDELSSVLKAIEFNRGGESFNITTQDFETTPLGSGVVLLVGAGLGYAAIKRRKEDEQ